MLINLSDPKCATKRAIKLKEKRENPVASSSLGILKDFLSKYIFEKHNSIKEVFVAEDFVSLDDQLTIPFSSKYLFDKGQAFIAKERSVRLVMDFIYDACSQGYKLGCVALLGLHFVKGEWKSTVIPLMFCVANVESTASYMAMLASCIQYMSSFHGIDLVEKTSTTISDSQAKSKAAIASFALALLKLCLEHSDEFRQSRRDKITAS